MSSPNPTEIRSVLYGSVESLLATVAQLRTQNTTEDALFGSQDSTPQVKLITGAPILSDLEVLLQEKNSLGLYVSGSPLGKYKPVLDWVRDEAGREDIHLLIIDKIRKIFTRSNTMMLAVAVTSADDVQYEGIVFPKNAPKIAPLLVEKSIFWVKGRVVEGRKRKQEEGAEEESSFEELPKIAFEEARPFEEGVLGLFTGEEVKLSINRQKVLSKTPWKTLLAHPEKLEDFIAGGEVLPDGGPAGITTIKLPSTLPGELLKRIKSMLRSMPESGLEPIELYVEKNGEYKKAKGVFYANLHALGELLDIV